MKVKEIYQNEVETGKIVIPAKTLADIELFERRLNLFDTQPAGAGIGKEFMCISSDLQQEAYIQGFRAAIELTADCFNKDL